MMGEQQLIDGARKAIAPSIAQSVLEEEVNKGNLLHRGTNADGQKTYGPTAKGAVKATLKTIHDLLKAADQASRDLNEQEKQATLLEMGHLAQLLSATE